MQSILKPKKCLETFINDREYHLGISIAQTGQWIFNSWINSDWIALGAASAGGLIVAAGIGSLITEWRRIYRYANALMKEIKQKNYFIAMQWEMAGHFVKTR